MENENEVNTAAASAAQIIERLAKHDVKVFADVKSISRNVSHYAIVPDDMSLKSLDFLDAVAPAHALDFIDAESFTKYVKDYANAAESRLFANLTALKLNCTIDYANASAAKEVYDQFMAGEAAQAQRQQAAQNFLQNSPFRNFNIGAITAYTPQVSTSGYSLKEGTSENDKEYKQKRAREEIQSKAGRAVQAVVDAFAPLAALERVLYGGVRGAEKSAWKMALMTRNLDQVMFHVLRVGGIKYNKADGSFVKRDGTKGLEEILKPVKVENYKNFEHYAKAKSAIERWGFLRKTNFFAGTDFYKTFGFSLEDAKKWTAEGSAVSKKAFGELQIFFQGQRDFMLETGLISPEQHAALSRFKNYVPFFREGADLDAETEAAYERFSEIFPAGKGFSGRKSGVEKFEGSARRTKNLVENIVNQSRKVIDSGYKNIAAYRSLNLMRELDMAKYVRSDSVDAQVKIAEMRRALEAEGIEVGDISDEELLKKVPVEAYLKITDDSNDNIVSVRVNGTLRFYKVEDPELLVAVKNFGAEKVNVMWKLLTAPKNIMTQAITKTPEFAIRNFIRDTGSNTILFGGKTLAPYLAHTAKNAVKSAWNTEDMQKVWAAGAGGGAWYSVKAEDIAADFKYGGKIQKIGKYTIKPLKWLLNEYERRILMPSEQGNRITVMQKALENGASDMEAAFQYLDVMNFGMRGSGVWTGKNEWAKGAFTALHAVVRITPFLNARIQGLYKLWRESGAQDARFKAGEEFALKERTRAFVQSLSNGRAFTKIFLTVGKGKPQRGNSRFSVENGVLLRKNIHKKSSPC